MAACLAEFAEDELVFFDPDNGLEVPSIRRGRKNSSKFLYLDEVRTFYGAGKSVLIYQHFPRKEREAFVTTCVVRLREVAPEATLWAFRTKHVVFLLLINPRSGNAIMDAAHEPSTLWDRGFLSGSLIELADRAGARSVKDYKEAARNPDDISPPTSPNVRSPDVFPLVGAEDPVNAELRRFSVLKRLWRRLR